MERLTSIHCAELSEGEFSQFPVWTWDDATTGFHPISGEGALPSEATTLFIHATFTTASGCSLNGYLIDHESFYAFGLFVKGESFVFNKRVRDLAEPALAAIERQIGGSCLPLRYRVDVPGFLAKEGAIDQSWWRSSVL